VADTPQKSAQEKAVDALLDLLADREWNAVSLPDIADKAGLTLAELRAAYPSKGAILAGFAKRIDQSVLKADSDLADQPARERLFDVMMRRFDALKPYKRAIASARRGLLADPLAASAWNSVEVNSAQWMLAAAGIKESGPGAAVKAQGLAMIFASVLATFLDDDDPDLTKTMRDLDIHLRRAERLVETGDLVQKTLSPVLSTIGRIVGTRGRKKETSEDAASAI